MFGMFDITIFDFNVYQKCLKSQLNNIKINLVYCFIRFNQNDNLKVPFFNKNRLKILKVYLTSTFIKF